MKINKETGMEAPWKNKLFFGDNLKILREHIASETIDLIYLDPPFNSKASYNVLFKEKSGERSQAQIKAFGDTWRWSLEAEAEFADVVKTGPKALANLMDALRSFLGTSDMMAYLSMMASRLVELRRVLKATGSIYLHCDPTASHYLKLLMDATFGPTHFRSEIIWKRSTAHSDAKQGRMQHGRIHDVILFYTRGEDWTWNAIHTSYDESYIQSHYRHVEPETGRRYRLSDLTAAKPGGDTRYEWRGKLPYDGRYWAYSVENMERFESEGKLSYTKSGMPELKRYLDEMPGSTLQDVWSDIDPVNSQAAERLGYPTQKPEELLRRIILSSSNPGDVVLDPFCGCGTAIAVAEAEGRRWLGIDITHLAVTLIRHRLHDSFGPDLSAYQVIGAPEDIQSAAALAQQDRREFELWALSLVEARPARGEKGADRGIDGYIKFYDDNSGRSKEILVQVKSGHVTVSQVRDLKGTMERERATMGVFITLQRSTREMDREAASAGFYEPLHFHGRRFPRIQILTVADLLAGKTVQYLQIAPVGTFRTAERRSKNGGSGQETLDL